MSTEAKISKAIADQKAITGIVWTKRQAANFLFYIGDLTPTEYHRAIS